MTHQTVHLRAVISAACAIGAAWASVLFAGPASAATTLTGDFPTVVTLTLYGSEADGANDNGPERLAERKRPHPGQDVLLNGVEYMSGGDGNNILTGGLGTDLLLRQGSTEKFPGYPFSN